MTVSAEQLYQERMDLLSPQERMARCAALLKWSRDLLARQIKEELGEKAVIDSPAAAPIHFTFITNNVCQISSIELRWEVTYC